MKTLWLVGMMGAGKSTVAKLLAARLGVQALDVDEEVERAAGMSVAEIFAREGEAKFRARELAVLEAFARRAAVIAVGGGALETPGAWELLRDGVSVYLYARPETLLARLEAGESFHTRPLLANLTPEERAARFGALLQEREKNYERANFSIETDTHTPEQTADAVLSAVQDQLEHATPTPRSQEVAR